MYTHLVLTKAICNIRFNDVWDGVVNMDPLITNVAVHVDDFQDYLSSECADSYIANTYVGLFKEQQNVRQSSN